MFHLLERLTTETPGMYLLHHEVNIWTGIENIDNTFVANWQKFMMLFS